MLKVAIIHDSPIPTPSAKQLLTSFIKRGVETLYLRISKLSVEVNDRGIIVNYGKHKGLTLDSAIIRGLGTILSTEVLFKRLDVLKGLELSGVFVVNPPDALLTARDKLLATLKLKSCGIRVPRTTIVEDVYEAVEVVRKWGIVVIKPLMGSLGYGSVKVTDPDVVYIIARTWLIHGQPLYIQKFTRVKERDIRVFVVGDEVLGAIYRYAPPHSWKTNVAQGARVEKAIIDEEVKEIAIKATKALGLLYAGVDVGEDEDGYVVYEVNSAPQWGGFMMATGINPAEKIAEFVINLLKK
ncbi:MAG: RimK family alpha-L-glutamate ligase [Thermoprotei archaeon]|nr:MAG: RimK family alpha-L-glutamate ligase [Thermoprotei archaeon]